MPKQVLYITVLRYTFHCHLLAISMDQQHMHLILLKIWVCFHTSLTLKPVWHPWVLGWPSNGPNLISKHTADCEIFHGLRCFMWHVEVNMWPDLQKPDIMAHSKIFSIKHYKIFVQKTHFIKYLQWHYKGYNLAILTPISKP